MCEYRKELPFGATQRVRNCAEMGRGRHADPAIGAFGGAHYGATRRVRGVPNWGRARHADPAVGAFGGAPYEATKRVRGVPKWGGAAMQTLQLGPSVELSMGPRSS